MDKRVTLALEDLKKTNYYMIGLILVSLTLIILLSNNVLSVNSNNKHYKNFVYCYQTCLSFSLLIFPCINLISNFFLAKNKTKLVNKYINHHDERKLFIYDKIGNNSVFILEITSMALASIIAPLYSFDLLLGIITCIFIIMIIRVYLYFYYNRKY